ncbi:uncharacterized protein [Elaeis guineensis]|uniref:Uncharacterized protein LOC105045941 isoform X2 n=1 Tax=Elaeis guineensis var. tenera TaxID=51953 RepID=A0A6I9R8N4_ELAGV|nr:uncharacterized protein LOC105045941 isoform X2 [Elaeis guineensis]
MESRGSERRRSLRRKPLADLTNAAPSLFSSNSTRSLLEPIPNPKPRPKPPQTSNPDEPSTRSNSGFNSTGHEDNGGRNVATSSPKSKVTFLDSVDDDAQHDNSNHSIVYARQTVEGRRCKEKEAGRRKWKEKEARMCKGKATPSTALSCPPVARTRSMKGKLVMEDDKFDHPKAFSVPYPEAKKKQRYTLPEDFIEKKRAYFAEIDSFELSEEVVSESELE